MAKAKVNYFLLFACLLIAIGAFFSVKAALSSRGPQISWRRVPMDGHYAMAQSVTAENAYDALGVFVECCYETRAGDEFAFDSEVARVARALQDAQPSLAPLKEVVGHSKEMLMNLRTQPDLPLGNLFADILRERGSREFGVPMDFAVTNYGGIRTPLPEGAITLEDISSMFPFKNYMCYVKMKGENLLRLLEQLAGTKAFQAVSGAQVVVKDHVLESALVGGRPIDPSRIYNVTTIDFLLDGGDKLNIGAMSESVVLSKILLKDVMLDYVKECESKGIVIEGKSDGRVIME